MELQIGIFTFNQICIDANVEGDKVKERKEKERGEQRAIESEVKQGKR